MKKMFIMILFEIARGGKKTPINKNLESTWIFIRTWICNLLDIHTIKYYITWKIKEKNMVLFNKDESQKSLSEQKKQITEEFTEGFNL